MMGECCLFASGPKVFIANKGRQIEISLNPNFTCLFDATPIPVQRNDNVLNYVSETLSWVEMC